MDDYETRKERAKAACKEVSVFNKFFADLLKKYVFDAFSKKLEECRQIGEKAQQQGLILLKLCGSVIDARFMLETVCENLELRCVSVEEHTNPLDLLKSIVDSEELHLVHVQDNVSLNYLNRLLETFCSSDQPVSLIITIRSNDSHVIRLDPSLAASVPVESFVFSDPEPLFERLVNELVLSYTQKTGLILSGPLLEQLKNSFFLEKQSFAELQNVVGMSIAKYGMSGHLVRKKHRKRAVVPDFEHYWLLLELFTKFLERENALDKKLLTTLEVHINIQSNEDWYIETFERAKSCWKNAEKNAWLHFINFCLDFAQDFQNKCTDGSKLSDVLPELEEIKEKIEKTTFKSMREQITQNITTSPGRRRLVDTTQQTKKIIETISAFFSHLKTFNEHSIPPAQPFESCQDENADDSQLPDFVRSSPYF